MDYYLYLNWTAKEKTQNLIHHWSCGDCRMGLGKHRMAKQGKHGVWVGPFITRDDAKEFSANYFATFTITNCKRCNKK